MAKPSVVPLENRIQPLDLSTIPTGPPTPAASVQSPACLLFRPKARSLTRSRSRGVKAMVCPQCSYENPEPSIQCEKCSTPFPLSDQTLATGVKGWSVPSGDVVISQAVLAQLSPGTVLA